MAADAALAKFLMPAMMRVLPAEGTNDRQVETEEPQAVVLCGYEPTKARRGVSRTDCIEQS